MITNVKLLGTDNDIGKFQYKDEKYIFDYPCNEFADCKPYQIDISPGKYLFEVWGAQGGNSKCDSGCVHKTQYGGFGGYSQSVYIIKSYTVLFLYIGAQPDTNNFGSPIAGGYNGGGSSGKYGGGGGGASDIRTEGGNWSENFDKRIIVAGGGGGDRIYVESSKKGGNGGGLTGEEAYGGYQCISCFGNTTSKQCEYYGPINKNCKYNEGVEGIGGSNTSDHDGGGGGGYIGGGASLNAAGGGGSGYIGSTSTILSTRSITMQSSHQGHGKIIITYIDSSFFSYQIHTCIPLSLCFIFLPFIS